MKKWIVTVAAVVTLQAAMVNKIAITVDDRPITIYDIESTTKQYGVDKESAIEFLIQKALMYSEAEKRGVYIDDFEFDNRFELIAKQSGMSLFAFKQLLLQKGELESFKTKLKEDLIKQKLFQMLGNSKVSLSQEDLKRYYDEHKEEFNGYQVIETVKYSAANPQSLQEIMKNPLANVNVSVENESVDLRKVNAELRNYFSQAKENSFLPIIQSQEGYVVFYVTALKEKKEADFESVKGQIYNILYSTQVDRAVKDYFLKIKTKANIKFIN